MNEMDRRNFNGWIKFIFAFSLIVSAICSALVYVYSESFKALICSSAGMLLLCLVIFCIHRLDDKYIAGIVHDLSRLTDILTELEEKEVFPDNEDTLISKLQSKIIKLVRILKKKNETSIQEQKNIKSLVSDISHQLKTPIANLIMYSGFLKDKSLSMEKQDEYIEIIRMSVDRLNFLSENMIKISRLEGGLIHLNIRNQSLNETVMKSVKDIYARAKKNCNEIIYMEEKDIILPHDRNWTAEAVFNLLDNAVKYSRRGSGINLTVKSYGMFASVEVTDKNPPIPENERNKIFSRFYRGMNSRNFEGIGIGLYLAREITVKQGGYMNLKSDNSGNTFSIVLCK